jgi:hypothetical protein
MDSSALQQQLFRQIKSMLPGNISFADAIADLLDISADSAYRRIRGEKLISFEEIQKLSSHYHISLDTMLQIDSKAKVFYGTWLGQENYGFEQYLQNMHDLLFSISKGDQKLIYYEAKDFPPFYYFHFPELAIFKNYFWMRVILSYPEYSKLQYEDCSLDGDLAKTGQEIIKYFNKVPSIEIWSMETINSTLNQIQYCREVGAFKREESIAILYEKLVALLEHVRDQAECGEKLALGQKPYGGPQFRLYYNEAYLGHNTIMTVVDGVETVFVNHGVLNLMYTHDKDFCANTRWYFENTMKKSAPISNVNDKERSKFFNHMLEKVSQAKANSDILSNAARIS